MEKTDLYNIYENLFHLLKYKNLSTNEIKLEKLQFYTKIKTNKYIKLLTVDKNNLDTIFILFYIDNHYNSSSEIKQLIQSIKQENYKLYLISKNELSAHIKKQIKLISTENKIIQNHIYTPFKLIVPNHILTSEHIILSKEEENDLIKKEKIIKTSLAKINHNDPMIIWSDGEVGNIVQINRNSEITGKCIEYRLII